MKISLYPDGRACLELDGAFRDMPANMVQGFLIGLAMLAPTPFNWNAYLLSAWVAHSVDQAHESPPPAGVAGFDGTNVELGAAGGGDTERRRGRTGTPGGDGAASDRGSHAHGRGDR